MINYFRFYTFMLALKTLAASISTKKNNRPDIQNKLNNSLTQQQRYLQFGLLQRLLDTHRQLRFHHPPFLTRLLINKLQLAPRRHNTHLHFLPHIIEMPFDDIEL